MDLLKSGVRVTAKLTDLLQKLTNILQKLTSFIQNVLHISHQILKQFCISFDAF